MQKTSSITAKNSHTNFSMSAQTTKTQQFFTSSSQMPTNNTNGSSQALNDHKAVHYNYERAKQAQNNVYCLKPNQIQRQSDLKHFRENSTFDNGDLTKVKRVDSASRKARAARQYQTNLSTSSKSVNYELLLRAQSAAMHDATIAASDKNQESRHNRMRKAANTTYNTGQQRQNVVRNTAMANTGFFAPSDA